MAMVQLFLLAAVVCTLPPHAGAFSPGASSGRISSPTAAMHSALLPALTDSARRRHPSAASSAATTTRLHAADDTQAEIAALEERLRQLKENEGAAGGAGASDPLTVAAQMEAGSRQNQPEPASMEPDGMEGETEDSVMFSERWKEAKEGYVEKKQEEALGGLGKVAAALGFVVFLGLFSQVPIGEDNLQRYQDVKGNPSRIDLGDLNTGE